MSRKSESAKLRRRPVHEEQDAKDGEGTPPEATDPIVKQEDEQARGVGPGAGPAMKTRRSRILHRSGMEIAFSVFIHLALLSFYIYAHVLDATIFHRNNGKGFEGSLRFGGRWKYFSYINFCLQSVYFFLAFSTDIMPHSLAKMWFRKLCDVMFTTVAFPLAVFVTVNFWGIYAIDRELIYPARLDEYIPTLLNHFWHTAVIIGVVIELLLVFHHYPANLTAAIILCFISIGYIAWISIVLIVDGYWVYPFLQEMTLPFVLVFFISSYFVSVGIYFIGKKLAYMCTGWKARHQVMDDFYLDIDSNY